ncbi:MAG: GNAT family N-acetyltransferase, partial [Chloroflexi bacterium]|nr:GNAT family N-acetyltransferase [Chloroflexota bacterium]
AMEDIFRICLDAEAEGFFVAEVEERLVGYVICVSRPGRLWLTAVRPRHAFRMLCRLLAGRYGIGLRGLMRLGADRIRFWLSHMKCSGERGAQILSIAVHPNFQGQGLGRRLMQAALGYLRSAGARQVKLEVRPQNSPALRLYERIGFRPVGTVRDSRGPWLVMVLRLEEDKDG